MMSLNARRIAARVALKIIVRRNRAEFRDAQRLLTDDDLFDAWYYGFVSDREPNSTSGFLEFLQELIQSIMNDPEGFITFITSLIEIFNSPEPSPNQQRTTKHEN